MSSIAFGLLRWIPGSAVALPLLAAVLGWQVSTAASNVGQVDAPAPAQTARNVQDDAVEGTAEEDSARAETTNAEQGVEKLILVVGAAGAEEFEGEFQKWADQWEQLAGRQQWQCVRIDRPASDPEQTPKEQLQAAIASSADVDRLWIVMLGHGTFARNIAKFNLQGPDVAASELKGWMDAIGVPAVVINCSSASAPFLTELSSEHRIVVTATKSGSEYNFSRFGKYLAQAINDPSIDLDHDNEVSLLEAFLAASSATQRFYREEARLATEQALLNDNGDKVGTTGDFYRGVRPVKESDQGEIDGDAASRIILYSSAENAFFPPELDRQRMAIEQEIDVLRALKSSLPRAEYFDQLEALLLRLAHLYDQAETLGAQDRVAR